MNKDPLTPLRDALLVRELSVDEERRIAEWLAGHPESVAEWQADVALARGLRGLPGRPTSSNFTARVLAEVRRESSKTALERRGFRGMDRWRALLPISATLILAIAIATGWQVRREKRQAEYVRNIAALRVLAGIPPIVLEDFDAIRGFGDGGPPVDYELLAALQ